MEGQVSKQVPWTPGCWNPGPAGPADGRALLWLVRSGSLFGHLLRDTKHRPPLHPPHQLRDLWGHVRNRHFLDPQTAKAR